MFFGGWDGGWDGGVFLLSILFFECFFFLLSDQVDCNIYFTVPKARGSEDNSNRDPQGIAGLANKTRCHKHLCTFTYHFIQYDIQYNSITYLKGMGIQSSKAHCIYTCIL